MIFLFLKSDNFVALAESTLAILHGLLSSIPTFWGSEEVTQVVNFYIEDCFQTSNVQSSPLSGLMKSVAKRIPAKILLPTLLELWAPLEATAMVSIETCCGARLIVNSFRSALKLILTSSLGLYATLTVLLYRNTCVHYPKFFW